MDRVAHTVAAEIAQHAKTAALDFLLYVAADAGKFFAGASGYQCATECGGSAVAQSDGAWRGRRNQHSDGGVSDVAAQLNGNVKLHHIARAQPARSGNPVDDLLVDADAGEAREIVDELRRGTRAMGAKKRGACAVKLGGGDARGDDFLHFG